MDPVRPGEDEALVHDAAARRWLRFAAPRRVLAPRTPAALRDTLDAVERAVETEGLWVAGFLSYEAAPALDTALSVRPDPGFPLAWFGLYADAVPVELPEPRAAEGDPPAWTADLAGDAWRAAFERVRDYIAAGDTYQVNLTTRLRARLEEDPWGLFLRMTAAQRAPYGAYVATADWIVCSASPELFLLRDGERVESRPMKGTAARGRWPEEDGEHAAALRASPKERAENVMITDMVRNDLGRVAVPGTVEAPELFMVERYPTLWQMTSTVRARSRAGLAGLLAAAFPPASVTGAPKRRTMEILAGLETSPRRVYCGAVGFAAPGGRAQFNVAIRTALVERATGRAAYGVGSGIVWDSTCAGEAAEWETKTRVLREAPRRFELLETLRWTPEEGYALRGRHLDRMEASARYFDFPPVREAAGRALDAAAAAFPAAPRRVRLLADRAGRCRCEAAPLGAVPPRGRPRVAFAAGPVDERDVFLYHKTTVRDAYERARAGRPDVDDVLLWNRRGEVTESTLANVVAEIGGAACTPPVSCGLLAGTARAEALARGELRERVLTRGDLRRAGRLWLLNSVRGRYEVERTADAAPA